MIITFWRWLIDLLVVYYNTKPPQPPRKYPPMPKCVEPGQGVRGETLGPRETIIPPKGGSGTAHLSLGRAHIDSLRKGEGRHCGVQGHLHGYLCPGGIAEVSGSAQFHRGLDQVQ
jgi:hypothetical protein